MTRVFRAVWTIGMGLVASLLPAGGASPASTVTDLELSRGYRMGRVLVKVRDTSLAAVADRSVALRQAEARVGVRQRKEFRHLRGQQLLELDPGVSVPEALAQLRATGLYEFVEPDYLRFAQAVPNDPRYGEQWSLNNSGQAAGTPDADIDAPEGWDRSSDASAITVAVIDSGVRLTHEDIVDNLWRNLGEIPGNGLDDDGNGYIDDVHGINSILPRSQAGAGNPSDDNGHGTHVAGIVGAVGNNGRGVAGVAWRVKIMALKFLAADGRGSIGDGAECIDYAIAQGAQVINASYGALSTGQSPSQTEIAAIQRARDAGIVFVAASGNDGLNLDVARTFPATYPVDNIIAVGNTTRLEDLAPSSNTGSGAVDLLAPGTEILSLSSSSDSSYVVLSGTSMAAPHVSGAVALARARFPGESYRQTINRVLRSVDPLPKYSGRVQTGGRLNLDRLLSSTSTLPFNDDYASRARLAGELIQVRASSTGATTESGEPAHGGGAGASVWWTWTALTSGTVNIDTQGSAFDTVLAVYTGPSLGSLTVVASNDDANTQGTSSVSFFAQAGTTYQIAVGGKGGAGLVLLNLGSVPANDDFSNASLLTDRNPIVTATNAKASSQSGEPAHAGRSASRSLWYRWVAPTTARYHAAAASAQLNPVVAVYTGGTLGSLTPIASNVSTAIDAETKSAIASFDATAGVTYLIAVDSAALGTIEINGEFTFTLTDAAWIARTDDSITSSAAVGADGTVYVGSNDSGLYAFNPVSGQVKWRYAITPVTIIDTGSAAVGEDGAIYFGASNGSLYAIRDEGTRGTALWVTPLGGPITNAPAIAADGTVYIRIERGATTANAEAQLVAVRPTDGAVLWRYTFGAETSYAAPSIGSDGTIYVAGGDAALHAVTPSGTRRWRFVADNQIFTSPAIDAAGNVYIASLSGTAYSVTPGGAQRWRFSAGGFVTSSLALSHDTAYFASYDRKLYALAMATGTLRWTYALGDEVRASSPAVAEDGTVFIGCYDRRVHQVNGDGTLRRTFAAANWFRSSPLLAGGKLYIGSNDGRFYALDVGVRASSAGTGPWPQLRHNVRRTGRVVTGLDDGPVLGDDHGSGRLANLSVRTVAGTGEDSLITGFVATGTPATATKTLLVRGIGPALVPFGVTGVVTDPGLRLVGQGTTTLASNDNWGGNPEVTALGLQVGAFALANSQSLDAALVTSVLPGPYTVQVSPTQGAAGVALAEVYDGTPAADVPASGVRLINLSVRARAGTGEAVLIAGFVIADGPRRVLVRGIGPALSAFGVGDALADPTLELFRDQTRIDGNDNWGGSGLISQAATRVGAFALPAGSRDAALVVLLPPGGYSVQLRGVGSSTGVTLVEVYEIR